MARIVQLANFVSPSSGGIRTALDALAAGYRAAGHERLLIVPGERDAVIDDRVEIRSPRLPGQPYRVVLDHRRARSIVRSLRPDRVEISDRLTLSGLGDEWPSVLVSHERVDAILRARVPPGFPLARLADVANRRLAARVDRVVCASRFVASEWARVGVDAAVVPLGVDLRTFGPGPVPRTVRPRRHQVELVTVGRLSTEKRPQDALHALARVRDAGLDAGLTFVGDGPLRHRLARAAARRRLPVRFTGHIRSRRVVAGLLLSSDLAVCPCPYEAFGLAAVEALACGTPVVVPSRGALPEIVLSGPLGCGVVDDDLATGIRLALRTCTRDGARRAAEAFPWSATVDAMLAVHGLDPGDRRADVA